MDWLRGADTALFSLLNGAQGAPLLDSFFLFLSYPPMRVLLFAGLSVVLAVLGGRRAILGGLALLVAVGVADQIAAGILKPWVDRVRPCFVVPGAELLIQGQARSPSFPSNHAANAFAAAAVIAWILPRHGKWAYLLASLIAISRVYIGVHYPLDIAAGAILGLLIGFLARCASSWAFARHSYRAPG